MDWDLRVNNSTVSKKQKIIGCANSFLKKREGLSKGAKAKVFFQPKDTGLCGQYAIANLIGCTPEESIKAFGKRGGNNRKSGTVTKDVSTGLKQLGYHSDQRMKLITEDTVFPDNCLICIGWYGPPIDSGLRRDVVAHWVAYKKGKIICSGHGICNSLKEYTTKYNGYASGYLEIKKI